MDQAFQLECLDDAVTWQLEMQPHFLFTLFHKIWNIGCLEDLVNCQLLNRHQVPPKIASH
eukprot:scaffold91210_cov31-Attheya_sp.AAC.1